MRVFSPGDLAVLHVAHDEPEYQRITNARRRNEQPTRVLPGALSVWVELTALTET